MSNTVAWIIVGTFFGIGVGVCFYEIVKTIFKGLFGKETPEANRSAKP